ncbi:myosin-9 isoform X3 [Dunckerocampus dactyliophorus]|uniref:myosin-9 isoform X3 n=1 Tax=Dunckerocampus dactyliophorus TaxID=161453 RepID=UPI0024050BE3|nr:myosin-9 isoform X3 [Dunckerocampus dactyliophorus]
MASVGMEEAMLMRDGEEVKVGIVLNPISGGSESVFINEDGQNVDYVSKEEKLQSFSFDQAVTVDNMQRFQQELLQPLTESICEGHSGSLLLCGASMENISTLIDHVIVKQVLINVLSRVMSQVKREVFISVSFLQFDPDGNGVDLLSPESNSPELVLHPVLGIVISDLSEACVGSAEEAYTVYKTCREAQKANETLRCGSLLFTMTVEWKLHTGEADFQFCRSRLQLFNLVGGACRTDPKGVNPLLKVVQQIQSEAAKADLLLPLLVNHLSTKAAVCRWSPREAEQEIRGRITALRRVMMSEAGNETHDTRRLAELIKHLQIVKDQSWEKRRKESERIQLKLNGAQCQADRHLSDIEPRESSATVKRFQEELKQEMEAHIKEDRESAEKVQERLTKILQLREALRKNTEKNISAVKCDLCLQLEERHAHGRRRQVKELSGRLIQQEVEKMEKDLAREQLPSEGPQRELLVLSRERQVLVLQMEALRAEAQQAQKALQDQYDVHQSEMQHLTEESLQVFRRFHESSKDVRRMSEVRYRSVLLEAVQDAVYLSAQNQQLQADNKRLRQALGELKDTLTKRGPHAATVFPSKHD